MAVCVLMVVACEPACSQLELRNERQKNLVVSVFAVTSRRSVCLTTRVAELESVQSILSTGSARTVRMSSPIQYSWIALTMIPNANVRWTASVTSMGDGRSRIRTEVNASQTRKDAKLPQSPKRGWSVDSAARRRWRGDLNP